MKECEYCRQEFKPLRDWQKFCGSRCRLKSFEERQGNLGMREQWVKLFPSIQALPFDDPIKKDLRKMQGKEMRQRQIAMERA